MALLPDPILGLEGRDLGNGWTVGKLVKAGPIGSGGHFSICYLTSKPDGTQGFLKAFDFRSAVEAPDLMRALQELTTAYNFERDLLDFCKEKRIRKVVIAMAHGSLDVADVPLGKVFYIVFELADGDARRQMEVNVKRNFVWIYDALHSVALGLRGLHNNLIFHQDLKPSNVLVFHSGKDNKVADLGRSHRENSLSPNEDFSIPGFIAYAPPEQLYGYEMRNSVARRASADLYQLGSLLLFFFTGVMATPALISTLQVEHRPGGKTPWTGTYEGILPYLDNAFSITVADLENAMRDEIPEKFHGKFIPTTVNLFRMLAAVRPEERGHPTNRKVAGGSPYDLERIISELDLLPKKAVIIEKLNAKAA